MRRFDTPYLADWLATSLRWVVLVGLLISLFLRGELGSLSFGLLLVMLGWNILNSILAILSIRLKKNHRQIMLAVDFLLAATLFWVQGGLASASAWVGLWPILTGAVYFEMRGAFLVAAVFALWQFVSSLDQFSNGLNQGDLEGILITLLLGLVCGLGGRLLCKACARSEKPTWMRRSDATAWRASACAPFMS